MPLYSFRCTKCNSDREVKFSYSEYDIMKDNVACECGEKMSRTVEAPLFSLAGGGWYKDGYGSPFSQTQHDSELRKYDESRNNVEKGKFDRQINE